MQVMPVMLVQILINLQNRRTAELQDCTTARQCIIGDKLTARWKPKTVTSNLPVLSVLAIKVIYWSIFPYTLE
jgi:hypothetical protein